MLKTVAFLSTMAAVATVEASATAAVSYNLYWWWVSSNGQFGNLFNVINSQQYDIIGYSECDDMRYVVENTCGSSCDYYNPQGAAMDNAAPMAWSSSKYTRLDEGFSVVASDMYGARVLNWVRLQETDGTVLFFANTHGPLGQADGQAGENLANNYIQAIESNIRNGDQLVFMGDFNVVQSSTAMQILSRQYRLVLTGDSFGGVDHILTNGFNATTTAVVPGWPSDHSLLKATFDIGNGSPGPSPTSAPPSDDFVEYSTTGCSNWEQITISTTASQGHICEELCKSNSSCNSFNVGKSGTQWGNYCSLMRSGCILRSDSEWDLFIRA